MDPPKSNNPKISTANKQLNLHEAFTTLQTHCSHFLQNLCSFPTHTQSPLNSFNFSLNPSSSSAKIPCWAQISTTQSEKYLKLGAAMSNEAIEERLAGVPVYALSNFNEEFVLVSGASTGKSLGLFCFKKEDADTLLHQMKTMDPGMRKEGSKVVAVALNKVFQLKVGGVAFRLIPESDQVKNALKERERDGIFDDGFSGVPVFQSRSLVLKSQQKSYHPAFFRKEDLEKSLLRASREQNQLNPAFRKGDIQVAVFEDIIKGMKESSSSMWDDVVFIPPGFDVSAATTPKKATQMSRW
ncbi:Tic22 domain-containing protein [Cephalotus follicularis]|uniref:Tic22 domain-containing protein n=1 Tax=Cephalotus follicularis TaxID=3775 RepID=A0A1Q3CAY1_CEPFO|nr:Tic22 domain-containing protein [Cephalotus follicularis]